MQKNSRKSETTAKPEAQGTLAATHVSGETTAYVITLKYTGEVTEVITAKSLEEAVEYLKKKHLPEDGHGDKSDWPDFMQCDFGSEIYKPENWDLVNGRWIKLHQNSKGEPPAT